MKYLQGSSLCISVCFALSVSVSQTLGNEKKVTHKDGVVESLDDMYPIVDRLLKVSSFYPLVLSSSSVVERFLSRT